VCLCFGLVARSWENNKSIHANKFYSKLLFLIVLQHLFIYFCAYLSANSAAFAAGILYFLTYFPYFFLTDRYETMTKAEKMSACLLHNMGMAFGVKALLIYEGTGELFVLRINCESLLTIKFDYPCYFLEVPRLNNADRIHNIVAHVNLPGK